MNIIKLDATASTNDYLKSLLSKQFVENLTVIYAETQTEGRGQMGAKWNSESGKNLTFSVLVRDLLLEIASVFHLNVLVAVSIAEALQELKIPGISIKWPNDILAVNKKIAGILIENSIKNNGEIFSVVGIGLNVNQTIFDDLPKATSLQTITSREYDKETVLHIILQKLQQNLGLLRSGNADFFWETYDRLLYKKGIPMPFEDASGNRFMGIIKKVNSIGKLEIQLEDDSRCQYDIKEVTMLY